jgi:hypothetical protein
MIHKQDHWFKIKGIRILFIGFYCLDLRPLIESSQVNVVNHSYNVKLRCYKLGHLMWNLNFLHKIRMEMGILMNLFNQISMLWLLVLKKLLNIYCKTISLCSLPCMVGTLWNVNGVSVFFCWGRGGIPIMWL